MKIPLIDLQRQYKKIKKEIKEVFNDILNKQQFILGPYVKKFESDFAQYCNAKHCIGVNSGTTALYLTLVAYGIGDNDEVIIPPNTFIATAEAVSLCGATPVFVDIEEKSFNINPSKIEKAITKKTKAIISVHLYGQCADMDAINSIAKKYNLVVIEDACQAHGAEYKKRKAGSLANIAAFSFYPGKNLGCYGEGGAVTTNNKGIAEKIRTLRDHGSKKKYYHDYIGGNFRMEALQGAVLSVKIKYLDEWTQLRRRNAKVYTEMLNKETNFILPFEHKNNKHVYHLYVIRTSNRDTIIEKLHRVRISTGIHYPVPLHLQGACRFLGYKYGDFPVAERVSSEILSLPMYPELKKTEISYVVRKLCKAI